MCAGRGVPGLQVRRLGLSVCAPLFQPVSVGTSVPVLLCYLIIISRDLNIGNHQGPFEFCNSLTKPPLVYELLNSLRAVLAGFANTD